MPLPHERVSMLDRLGSAPDFWVGCSSAQTEVELLMAETVTSLAGPLTAPVERMVRGTSKRLRPGLTMAFARLGDEPAHVGLRPAVHCAAAVELLHCATLIHDDLIDGSAVRRGVASVSGHEGAPTAVVAGDLLIAAASLLAGQVSQDAAITLARTLAELCRGEAAEDQHRDGPPPTLAELLDVVRAKTGSLVRAACLLGARCWTDDSDTLAAAAEYGMQFGICLQLVDDLLDVVSTAELAGKPVGADFAAGTVTVPGALALSAHPELLGLLGKPAATHPRSLEILRSPEAVLPSIELAVHHAELAAKALDGLPSAAGALAGLPLRYVRDQLQRKTRPELRQLLTATGRCA